jgi:multimeric flavodoxin WrbA
MKIVAFNGSPRKKGNTSAIIKSLLKGAESKGHKVKSYNVAKLKIGGCVACMKCNDKSDYCVKKDDMTDIYKEINEADYLIFGSPIYFGHVTGQFKTFMDRLYPYCKEDFSIQDLPGKKVITVVTSGAPAEMFCEQVHEFFKTWFQDFFKMQITHQLTMGDLKEKPIDSDDEVCKQAFEIGNSLS